MTTEANEQPNDEQKPNPAPLTLENGEQKPAVPPIAEQPPEQKPEAKDEKVEPVIYNPTGDSGLDMALKFVGEQGYGPDHPAMKAAMEGDFTMLKADLAAKGVKGADAYIELGTQAFTRVRAAATAKQAKDREAVLDAVGGEEAWTAIQKWARENATPEEAKEFSAELGAGGLRARAAATYLRVQYEKAAGSLDTDGPGPVVAKVKGSADNSGALSPRDYAKEVAKARIGFKGDFDSSPEYRALQARRAAWRG